MVPEAASRCKHCFHDFNDAPLKSGTAGLIGFLGLLLAMVGIGYGVFFFVNTRAATENIVIDEESASIVFTKTFKDRVETERIPFAEVAKIEYRIGGDDATFVVRVVTLDGRERNLKLSDEKQLGGYAQHVAAVIEKPVVEENLRRHFGDRPLKSN
jgi:hypothetical protein